MAKLRKSSLREQCYSIIKEKILRQKYDLGEFINILALSNELEVSNTPIREALSLLEADGFVSLSLNSKARVTTFDNKSYREMTQTISILLSGAYDLCIQEGKPELVIYFMRDRLNKQKELLDQKDYFNFIHASISFDKCVLDALGNTRLLSVFNGLSNVLFLMVRTNHQKDDNQRILSIHEHEMILDAVIASDHARAKSLMEHHYNKDLEM